MRARARARAPASPSLSAHPHTLTPLHNTKPQIEDIHLVRDKGSGKSKGFAFVKYEDQRSTVLAVDNFNGIKVRRACAFAVCVFALCGRCGVWCLSRSGHGMAHLFIIYTSHHHPRIHTHVHQLLERTLRVDHKAKYALPKEIVEKEEQKEKEVRVRALMPPLALLGFITHTYTHVHTSSSSSSS